MTHDETINRRAFMGTMAAATAGAVAAPGAADSQDDDQQGSASSNHVAQYASPTGRVNTEGLDEAFADWNSGNLSGSQLDDVIDAWNTGRRVVTKTVVDLSNNISSDRTILKDPNNPNNPTESVVYRVTSDINVSAELTIEPGVVMEFQQGTSMTFQSGSTILAQGTAQDGIFVSATNATRGWWDGFYFNTEDVNNEMAYVTMEYGGRDFGGNVDMASDFGDTAALTLTNCTLRRSEGYGLYLDNGATLGSSTQGNTYSYNRSGGAFVRTSNMHTLSSDGTYVDNDKNYVFVSGNTVSGAGADSETRTWPAIEVPWRVNGGPSVDSLSLDIEPGAEFEFTQASRLTFDSSARMLIEGTAQNPITFTGSDDQRGWWDGIYTRTTDVDNVMNQVVVEYGGNGLSGNLEIATDFGDSGELILKNCTFRNGGGYGLYCGSSTTLKEAASNTYTGNTSGAARIQAPTMDDLSKTSSFTGNDNDYVQVSTNNISGSGPGSESITWDNIDVPWRIDGTLKVNEIELIVEHGGTFEFTESSRLTFQPNARMNIRGFDDSQGTEGTPDEITFTGTDSQRGWWDGIYMNSTDTENRLNYVLVEYGGADLSGNLEIATNFGDSGELELYNSTFRESAGYGLYCGSNTTLKGTGANTYTANADGPVRIQAPTMHMLSDGSDFTGNDNDYVQVSTNNVTGGSGSITWDNINVPWRIDGTLKVNDYELVVDPGATFEFTQASELDFESNSTITVEGNDQNQITFTGTQNQRGWWNGIYLNTESLNNTMYYTTVEYAANNLSGNVEVATDFGDSGRLGIQNCTFQEADGFGLYAGSNTNFPNEQNNAYTSNASGAASLPMDSIQDLSDTSSYTGNDTDEVEVRDANLSSGDLPSGQSTATWDGIDAPYRFAGTDQTHQIKDVELVIDPGAELQFEEQAQLQFTQNSVITIEGTANDMITITGTEEIAGWWDGIYIASESFQNTIDYAIVEYGGRDRGGNITLGTDFGDGASVAITNCIIRNSRGAGVFADDDDPPRNASSIRQDNTFSNNQGGDYVVDSS